MRILAGLYKSRELLAPKGEKTRPTSAKLKESIFNILQNSIEEALFLDLFAGTGAVGLEAISRGCSKAVFVEKDKNTLRFIEENGKKLDCRDKMEIYCVDTFTFLSKWKKEPFDVIFADPPYRMGYGEKLVSMLDELNLLKPEGTLFVEEAKQVSLAKIPLKNLKLVKERPFGDTTVWEFRCLKT
jgi:16S rRNA (guanine966-N2)-methyltransferase